MTMTVRIRMSVAAMLLPVLAHAQPRVGPDHVDITWLSVTNVFYEIGATGVLTDGYVSRIPQAVFHGGNTLMAQSRAAQKPDVATVRRVLGAIGGAGKVQLLLTGHSHFDHSFDTGAWATLTGAPIMGSRTTCFQAFAQGVARDRCKALEGGERIELARGVAMYVIRWNHSGDHAINPEQHDPLELAAVPLPDSVTGGLRPGLAEDFPNGGGSRAYLFVADGPSGRYSWFFQNSASPVDLEMPVVVDGVDYGAPLENLKHAMKAARLASVDLWIGTGGTAVGALVLPVLNPKAFLPIHWDNFFTPFEAGVARPYADAPFEATLAKANVALVRPTQYLDKWRLTKTGVVPMENSSAKAPFGFK